MTGTEPNSNQEREKPASDRVSQRLHCIDAIRCIAFLLLVAYHAGLLFTKQGWHIRLPWHIPGLTEVLQFVSQWRMMLIFLVSGTALSFSLGRRSPWQFISRSARRLLPPLIFGLVVFIPPVVYFVEMGTPQEHPIQESYAIYFSRLAHGDLQWLHLWYLGYLFAFCVGLGLMWQHIRPVVEGVRQWPIQASLRDLACVIALCLPIVLAEIFLRPIFPPRRNFVSDWASVVEFGLAFMYGGMLLRNGTFFTLVEKYRHLLLVLAALAYTGILLTVKGTALRAGLVGLNEWLWLLTIVAWAYRYLNRRNEWVVAFNRIVFPFYLIHQIVLIGVAFLLSRVSWPAPILLYLSIFLLTVGICCLLISKVFMKIPFLYPALGITPVAEKEAKG